MPRLTRLSALGPPFSTFTGPSICTLPLTSTVPSTLTVPLISWILALAHSVEYSVPQESHSKIPPGLPTSLPPQISHCNFAAIGFLLLCYLWGGNLPSVFFLRDRATARAAPTGTPSVKEGGTFCAVGAGLVPARLSDFGAGRREGQAPPLRLSF